MKNKKLTKADVIDQIYKEINLQKKDIVEVTDTLLTVIKNSLINDFSIELRGFGTFEPVIRKEKKSARNPKTGKVFTVPAHYVANFKPGKELKESLLKKEFNIKND